LAATAADAGLLFSAFIAARGGISEDDARAAIERGGAFLRGRRERHPSAQIRTGDLVEVSLRPPEAAPALGREHILHLDGNVIAINKPAFVSAQEDRQGGDALPELCTALLAALGERSTKALLVHRLDRGTTGVTLLARTRKSQAFLLEQFRERAVKKEYRALAAGQPAGDEGEVALALGADPRATNLRMVDPAGDPALTRWRVLERLPGAVLVAAFPETGRTHQIRVHLRALGTPLLGDPRYGGPQHVTRSDGTRLELERPMLHARALEVPHPRNGILKVQAPEPADFERALAFLRAATTG
jgi:23S rRNA pseudouridine1911/1915/1917 synthase